MPEANTERAAKAKVADAVSRGRLDPMKNLSNALIRQVRKDISVKRDTKVLSIDN